MIILDVETTGTESDKHSLLSIGAVDFSNPKVQFYAECRAWEGAHINDEALVVNGYTTEQVSDPNKRNEAEILAEFTKWLESREDHTIAGQNPFFDTGFLRSAAMRAHTQLSIAHRIVDLHSIVYFHMIRHGITPPIKNRRTDINSDSIMTYVGIPAEPKPHIALNGAIWEAEAFSRLLNERPLFDQFVTFGIPWL